MRYWWLLLVAVALGILLVPHVSKEAFPSDFVTGADHDKYIRVDVFPGSASPGQVVCIDFSPSVYSNCHYPDCRDLVVTDSSGTVVPFSFSYMRPVTIHNPNSEDLADFQVRIVFDSASLIAQGKMRPDCADLRFSDATGASIPYWIESGCNTSEMVVWVKVPSIPANGSTTIYMYYGAQPMKKIIVASDGHYGYPDVTTSSQYYQDFVSAVNSENAEYVFINGDLVHDDTSQLTTVRDDYLSNISAQWYAVPGNHDLPTDVLWQDVFGYGTNYVVDLGDGFVAIVLNTSDSTGAYLEPDTDFLEAQLSQAQSEGKRVLIFQHIPPSNLSEYGVDMSNELAVLESYKDIIVGVFVGHDHDKDYCTILNGILWCFDGHFGSNWGVPYRGYRVIEVYSDGHIVTYMKDIGGSVRGRVVSSVWNGGAVFDAFADVYTDTNWITYQAEVSVGDGYIHIEETADSGFAFPSAKTFEPPFIIEEYVIGSNDNGGVVYFASSDSLTGIGVWVDYYSYEYRLYKFDNGLAGDIPPSPVSGFSGESGVLSVYVKSLSDVDVYYNGELVLSSSAVNPTNTSGLVGVYTGNEPSIVRYVDLYWIRVRKYAPSEPTVTIGAESVSGVCFDPGYDGGWTSRSFYVFLGSDENYASFRAGFGPSQAGDFSYTINAISDVSLYPGHVVPTVSPATEDPGDKNVTLTVYSDAPTGVSRTYCSVVVHDPILSPTSYEFDVNGPVVSFTHSFVSEGVYVIDYNCYVFFTEPISGSVTHTIVVPDPSTPSLSLSVSGIPQSLSSPSDVNILVYVTSDGSPVQGVACYLDYNSQVYESDTNADGFAQFSVTLYPDTSGVISCYRSGYHPATYEFEVTSTPSGGGGGGAGGGAGAGAGGAPLSPTPQPSAPGSGQPSVQAAAPVSPPSGVGTLAVLVLVAVVAVLVLGSLKKKV